MPKLGDLLPTRERIMEGRDEAGSLLALAERAGALGFDSVWAGDSVLARPRHDPLTLLAAVAARTWKAEFGTAVLLPALRNPVPSAHQITTLRRRDPAALTPAMYVTLALDDDPARADTCISGYLERDYGLRPDAMRKRQMCFVKGPAVWLKSYVDAGGEHMCLRLAGEPEQMEALARMHAELGW